MKRKQNSGLTWEDEKSIRSIILFKDYATFHLPLAKLIGIMPAIVFQNYVQRLDRIEELEGKRVNRFIHTNVIIREYLGISTNSLSRYKKTLIEYGLISVKRKDAPSREWIKVHYDSWLDLISLPKTGRLASPKQGGYTIPPKGEIAFKRTKKKNNQKKSWSDKLVELYIQLMKEHHPRKSLIGNKQTYSKAFESVKRQNNLSPKQIKELIVWYIPKIGEPYFPMAYSPNTFHEKINKIIAAQERDNNPSFRGRTNRTLKIDNKRKQW
jgi:hypothetical protein